MKRFLLLNILILAITQSFAGTTSNTASNNNQPIVVLGEINDQTANAESRVPILQPTPKFIQEQNAISNQYDQKQEAIAEEEEYEDEMEFGMFGDPFWGDDNIPNTSAPFIAGPGMVIPLGHNTDTNNSNVATKPKMVSDYESQLSNGDILFKQ